MSECEKIFPTRLKVARNGKSQKEIAKSLGVPQQTFANWEACRSQPNFKMLLKIATQLQVSLDWLLGLTDSRDGGGAATATNGSAAATGNARATVSTACASRDAEVSRLLTLIESQQRVIETLSKRSS